MPTAYWKIGDDVAWTQEVDTLFDEYQMVQLRYTTGGLAAGTIETVVMVYTNPSPGYEVEFCDPDGFTLALLTLHDDDLVAAPERDRGPR